MQRKLRMLGTLVAGLVLFMLVSPSSGQQGPKPGPEHKSLEPLIGTFNTKVLIFADPSQPPAEMEGSMARRWILDGLFLQEAFTGKLQGVDFKGVGIVGYDSLKKKYVATWIDSMDSGIALMEGAYDATTKTFNMHTVSDEIDPATGKKIKSRGTIRLVNNDHHMQEMFRTLEGGKEMKVMEIHYQRVKK